jgi:hypothetical protein
LSAHRSAVGRSHPAQENCPEVCAKSADRLPRKTAPAPNKHPPKQPKSAAVPHLAPQIDLFLRGKAAFFAPFFLPPLAEK